MEDENKLGFKISSYLKSVLGKDLITSDLVAIFELVKNSFDARASKVDIYFHDDAIIIADNGKGMSYDDLVNKWLFVAYSAKQDGQEDIDYRDELQSSRYAGSKGVGRFSCDRLGSFLTLETRSKFDGEMTNQLLVDWNVFELDSKEEFKNIPVTYSRKTESNLSEYCGDTTGTFLKITALRSVWSRAKLLKLKASLAKLINPFGKSSSPFAIILHVPSELEEDQKKYDEILNRDPENELKADRAVVNGQINNFIFSDLEQKTTWLNITIDDENKRVVSKLIDRGQLIYKTSEPCHHPELLKTDFSCDLFYLNRAAKHSFTRKMGVQPVKFGSVFLFKNGFRVFPIGEEGNDEFQIDRRKQQGYARYLGTRDLLGRIDVSGSEDKFREASSRDRGLVATDAYVELVDFFNKKCLQQLELYVVGVSWRLKFDTDISDASFLEGDEARAKVIDVISRLVNVSDLKIEEYSPDILKIISNKVSGFGTTIENLSKVAEKVGDLELVNKAKEAAVLYAEMQKAEAEAIAFAERERQARLLAEEEVTLTDIALRTAKDEIKKTKEKLEKTAKRNLFLTSLQSRGDRDKLENLHHQILIYASNALNQIEAFLMQLKEPSFNPSRDTVSNKFENLLLLTQQIIAASKFATSADFLMQSSEIEENLSDYIEQYINRVCQPLHSNKILFSVNNECEGFELTFKPIEISIIVDNLISNAEKAGANVIRVDISRSGNVMTIKFSDDGLGIPKEIDDWAEVFEKGITTTTGSGLGLYHVRQLLERMQGSISVFDSSLDGTTFEIKVYK
ncbi:ATP-binding protein [Aeromonas hydrophila]|uniref:ATP-binding protein n=1 Tax=Aeromonas hydrophila TaxID=644 RepID=UPI002B46562F|nr:sensor histidine kinase [Aeromonas hydrophila]